jgi:hypothetical protein
MTLPAHQGAISLNNVNVELWNSGTAQVSLGDAAVRTLFGIPSGGIDMCSGHGQVYWPYNGPPGWAGAPYYYWVRGWWSNPQVWKGCTVIWESEWGSDDGDPSSMVWNGYTYYRGALVYDTGTVWDDFLGYVRNMFYKIRRE